MTDTSLRRAVVDALARFDAPALLGPAIELFGALGYRSERRFDVNPAGGQALLEALGLAGKLNAERVLLTEWRAAELIFQLTAEEVRTAGQLALFDTKQVEATRIESYLLLAIDLVDGAYTRTQLATITREINRHLLMPVLVLFRHGPSLTFAVIDRRLHKRDESRDVLEKITLIKDIVFAQPHRAHIEILADLALPQLAREAGVSNFVELHRAWRTVLDSTELNRRFYREVANWYFWAVEQVEFPAGAIAERPVRNATSLIRLITRLIFVWFLKEKGLVPDELFNQRRLREQILTSLANEESSYYKAILQNLFFATLNQEMNTPQRPSQRAFRGEGRQHYNITTLYRYKALFRDPDAALALFADIPFLNGGLFECLDKRGTDEKVIRVDGFSDRDDVGLRVPNELFFGAEHEVDLNATYGTSGKRYQAAGLITILQRYKFTVAENTPIEEEVALDPELLGQVFENLLAAYNPETQTTARKQTGSFYTPRPIVNYMVDEALVAYSEAAHGFSPDEVRHLIIAIDGLRILDPAAGSGAFPMGVLQKLVHILSRLDPGNARWKERQISKVRETIRSAERIDDADVRDRTLADLEAQIEAIREAFERNELDYGRKLFLIENCIYGVDIQPIAVQIAKLRCFIALVVDQRIDNRSENRGIRPLPNLETKFVAANTLVGVPRPAQLTFRDPEIEQIENRLHDVRARHFSARTPKTKQKYREQDGELRAKLAELLRQSGFTGDTAAMLAAWDPYDQNIFAPFFDSEWMFGIREGFDVIIGNPPYVRPHKLSSEYKEQLWKLFRTFVKKSDLYCCFVEKSTEILKRGGVFVFIISDGFLRLDSFEELRKLLLKETSIQKIIDFKEDVFDNATVKTCIMLFLNSKPKRQKIAIAHINANVDLGELIFKSIEQESISKNYKSVFDLSSDALVDMIKSKISANSLTLGSLFEISFGLKTGDDEMFLSFDSATIDHKPLLRGEDIWRYGYSFKGEYVWYNPEKMRANKTTARPGNKGRFEQPKVLIRDTGNGLMGTFDDDNFYVKDVLIIHDKQKRSDVLKILIAILNSSTLRFYYETTFPTLHVQKNELASLPIKIDEANSHIKRDLLNTVEQIFAMRRRDSTANVSSLEKRIDQLVYQVYGLSSEDIAVIEGLINHN